jgi:acetolactate synthase-1/2/3 large subunit
MWAAQFYKYDDPNTFISSGGLGTMGYGFPAAMGVKLAFPDRIVVDIAGDGSIQMNIQEMATCMQYNIPVKIVLLNNGYLGMVRQWQELFYERRYSGVCLERTGSCPPDCARPDEQCPPYIPDFVKLAQAYGAAGIRIARDSEIAPALEEARRITDRPIFLDFLIQREANVWPMVPAGAGIHEMMNA